MMSKSANSVRAAADTDEEESAVRLIPARFLGGDDLIHSPSERPTEPELGLAPEDEQCVHDDTIPCASYSLPPDPQSFVPSLERTLRFAQLVLETMDPSHHVAHLLELAIIRRDAALLQALMRHLHQLEQEAIEEVPEDAARSVRTTILPPPPSAADSDRDRQSGTG